MNSRRGMGFGRGSGYYNIAPMDSHIHSLSAKGVKTSYSTLITPPFALSPISKGFMRAKGWKRDAVRTFYCPYCDKDTDFEPQECADWFNPEHTSIEYHCLTCKKGVVDEEQLAQMDEDDKVDAEIERRQLEKYEKEHKLHAKGFVSDENMGKFGRLDSEFSPENLTCDGELSNSQVRKKYAMLMREWRALEKELGFKVSRDEVEDWIGKIQRDKAREDAEEQHRAYLHHENTMREENKLDAKGKEYVMKCLFCGRKTEFVRGSANEGVCVSCREVKNY